MLEYYPFFKVQVFDEAHKNYPEPVFVANLRASSEEQAVLLATFNYARQNKALARFVENKITGKILKED